MRPDAGDRARKADGDAYLIRDNDGSAVLERYSLELGDDFKHSRGSLSHGGRLSLVWATRLHISKDVGRGIQDYEADAWQARHVGAREEVFARPKRPGDVIWSCDALQNHNALDGIPRQVLFLSKECCHLRCE